MCGFAGILTSRADLEMAPALQAMQAALRHRGPDDEGSAEVAIDGGFRLGLTHTRLAILDLSDAGHQPMSDPESGSWIVYNGEVYNHLELRRQPERGVSVPRWRSTSDTETILSRWVEDGDAILKSLRGMFALALLDGRSRQFWLVRDRLGVKPLYVSRADAETWIFASEVRAILALGLVPRRLNARAVNSYLAFGAVPAPWTLVDGVESLLPGECLRFDLDRRERLAAPERMLYWRPGFARAGNTIREREEALERLRPILREAAELRMLADVPVGVFLSGGIDSSALVSLLSGHGRTLHTFSVVFGERSHDESVYSRLVANQFGTRHTELLLRPAEVLKDFDQALRAYDQPSIDGLNTYFIARSARQAGVRVALSGLGGDELFCGYSYFRQLARLERPWMRRLAKLVHHGLRWLAPDGKRTTKLGRILGENSRLERYAVCREVLDPGWRRELLGDLDGPLPLDLCRELESVVSPLDTVNAQSLLELSLYLPSMLLRDADQMSMAHALEVREPLLDHVLVETIAALPGAMKLRPGKNSLLKGLLVDALPSPLPPRILNRRKMGFVFPWERWLRHELAPRLAALLDDESAVRAAGLKPEVVRRLWDDYLAHKQGLRYTDVLAVAHLIHWVRQNRLSADNAEPRSLSRPLLTADN
jgi:asparagine synthase (glutamine-hydrolysing)